MCNKMRTLSARSNYILFVHLVVISSTLVQLIRGNPRQEHRGSDSVEIRAKHLVKEQKLEILITNIIMQLSKYDDVRKSLLSETAYQITQSNAECFLKTFNMFKEKCVPTHLHRKVKKHRYIFAHACLADWIDMNEIYNIIKETCKGIKLNDD